MAEALGLSIGQLRFYACHRLAERSPNYVAFTMPKRTGGERLIMAPCRRLKEVQRRDVEFSWAFASLDDAIGAQFPAGPVVDISRQVGVDEVRRVLGEFFAPRVRSDGSVIMDVVFRVVVARPRG